MKKILVQEALCSGCRACEIACVVEKEGFFGAASARIRVTKAEAEGLDQPRVCQLCKDFPCIVSCPTEALIWDEAVGRVLLCSEDCISCAICVDVCPFNAIWMHPEKALALICDLCEGEPACVKRCATGAIVFGDDGGEPCDEG